MAMAGNPGAFDSQGIQIAPEVVALISMLLMPGGAKFAQQVPGQIGKLSEAGSVFPEGGILPKQTDLIKELGDILPQSEKNFVRNRYLSDWHAENHDWPRVLADKWALLSHSGGS